MAKLIKFGLSFLVGLTVFFIILLKIGLAMVFRAVGLFFSLPGLFLLILTLFLLFISSLKWKIILQNQGESFSSKELFPFVLIGSAMSYLTPFAILGGEFFRVYFFKKKYQAIETEKAIASVACDRLLEITAFFVFLIAGLFVFWLFGPVFTSVIGFVAMGFAGVFLFLLLFFYFKNWQKKSALKWLVNTFGFKKRFADLKNKQIALQAESYVFRFFSLKNKALFQAIGLTFLEYVGIFLRATLLVFFITGSFTFVKSLAIYGFANLASLTPMPATLGTLELSQGFAFSVLGFNFNQGAVFSLVWRAVNLAFSLIGILFLIKYTITLTQEKLL
ncbi:flippase-like domain-containing protein, partial [Candidatus Gribaldobacteria bacterium]|nr:flippase-like domain-containing protein [Candidatus Gribaldobacteria bacterium]